MWKLLLQLFAEDEQTPTEEVEASSVDATEDDDDIDFNDIEEDDDDIDLEEDDIKPQQSKKQQNKEYAQKRIKAKKEAEEKLAKEKRDEFLRGVQFGNDGKNRFTGREIKDEEDLAELELMLEMEKKGLDPLEDYTEYLKEKRREERKAELERKNAEAQAEKESQEDIDKFYEKYSKEKAQELFKDKNFLRFSDGLLGAVPLTVIYEKFQETKNVTETQAEKLAREKDARRKSSSGSLTENQQPQRKPFSEMTDEEFRAFQNSLL